MIISGKIITLRAIEEDDLEMLRSLINNSEVEHLVGSWNPPISKFSQQSWFDKISKASKWESMYFTIETQIDGAVGYLILYDIDWKNRRASYGMKTRSDKKMNNVGFDTATTIMKYVFNELNLNKLECEFIETNAVSIHVHRDKCHWNIDGIKRQHLFQDGKYHDVIIMSILQSEYRKNFNLYQK